MKIISALVILFAVTANAQTPKFDGIDQSEMDSIAKEMTANFAHSTVSGASSLGEVFGFEATLIGGVTKSPEIDRFTKQVDPNANAANLINAVLAGQVSVPYGVTGEVTFFPAVGSESFKFNNLGLGVKWTLTQGFLELPVDVAVKLNYTMTNLTFSQTLNNASTGNTDVDAKIENKSTILGAGVFVSKEFAIIEPYFGLAFLSGKTDLTTTASSGTIFASSTQSMSSNTTGTMMTLGFDINIGLKLGAEYSSLLGTSRMLGKLGFSF